MTVVKIGSAIHCVLKGVIEFLSALYTSLERFVNCMQIHTVQSHAWLAGGNSNFCPHFLLFWPDYCKIVYGSFLGKKKLLGDFEFCENTSHEGRTILVGVNEFLSKLSTLIVRFWYQAV